MASEPLRQQQDVDSQEKERLRASLKSAQEECSKQCDLVQDLLIDKSALEKRVDLLRDVLSSVRILGVLSFFRSFFFFQKKNKRKIL